jgi:flagellar basal body-associated protein FliL
MKEKIGKILIISVIILVILAVMFYWFAWRPSYIRKSCMKNAQDGVSIKSDVFNPEDYLMTNNKKVAQEYIDNLYFNCLREHGLEK